MVNDLHKPVHHSLQTWLVFGALQKNAGRELWKQGRHTRPMYTVAFVDDSGG